MSLGILKIGLIETAESLGHVMGKWIDFPYYGGSAVSFCQNCTRGLSVMVDPPDGERQIGGSAHERRCNGNTGSAR